MTVDPHSGPLPTGSRPPGARVLVLNHGGDPFPGVVDALRQSGFDVAESSSLRETEHLLRAGGPRPAVLVFNPMVLLAQGVEFELIQGLQDAGEPLPVILLVDGLEALEEARQLPVQVTDFVLKPPTARELVHRVGLAVSARDRFLQLHRRARELANQVTVDFKTGLLSERHFKNVLAVEFKRAQRHHLPLSLLLIDVDNFKGVNDSTEYGFGDQVLCEVARALGDNVRETDFAARFGGDEFVVLLPHTTPAEAVHTAMRIRQRIAATVVQSDRYQQQVTVSIGIDTYDGRSATATVDELRRRANKALQEAKRRGKDQVWLYSERANGGGEAHDSSGEASPA